MASNQPRRYRVGSYVTISEPGKNDWDGIIVRVRGRSYDIEEEIQKDVFETHMAVPAWAVKPLRQKKLWGE